MASTKVNAVLPDKKGVAQFLLIPTRRVTGIESPLILEQGTPNFWNAAWVARSYVLAKLHKAFLGSGSALMATAIGITAALAPRDCPSRMSSPVRKSDSPIKPPNRRWRPVPAWGRAPLERQAHCGHSYRRPPGV
jgi:CDP-diacylglycerol pyrophosphatase